MLHYLSQGKTLNCTFGCRQRFQWADLQRDSLPAFPQSLAYGVHMGLWLQGPVVDPYLMLCIVSYLLAIFLLLNLIDLYRCPQGKSHRCLGNTVTEGSNGKQIAIQLTTEYMWVDSWSVLIEPTLATAENGQDNVFE